MIKNIVVISDLHCGCQFGLCPPKVKLDGGGPYYQSKFQRVLWKWWLEWWKKYVPEFCKGEEYAVVLNGDAIDGPLHHGVNTQFSSNLKDQINTAYEVLAPVVDGKKFFFIRGTEAHAGKSAEYEEILGEKLRAIKDEIGNYTRWELWLHMQEFLIHFKHHIGGTTLAPDREMKKAFTRAGRFGKRPPNIIIRSHQHQQDEKRVGGKDGYCIVIVTPGWQLKTPLSYRLASMDDPQVGGYVIRNSGMDGIYTRFKTFDIDRPREEMI